MPQIVVKNLMKRYAGVEAVRGVSFDVEAGEIFGLLGPNGAGKTTTLECVIGLRLPDTGSIEVCGVDAVAEPRRVKQMIGAQLQSTALQDKVTPRKALRLFTSFFEKHAEVNHLIDRFALAEKADEPFDTLSGGQKQRLGLALAFVNEPRVVFLDEPTTGLDPQSRRDLHDSIRQIRAEGRSVLLTTHYLEEAEQLCDRIAIVDHGRLIASGTPSELIGRAALKPRLRFRASRLIDLAKLRGLPGVSDAAAINDGYFLKTTNMSQSIIELVRLLEAENNDLLELQVEKPTLEEVFIELTGVQPRD